MRLYFAYHNVILKIDSEGIFVDTVANTTSSSGLDFHIGKGRLYWSDLETRKVSPV